MNPELEQENEYELENELELENEQELEGELENENEWESELELENEGELESHEHEQEGEQFLGSIASSLGSLLGEGEGENEFEGEQENEFEFESGDGEQFFKRLKKFASGAIKGALPVLKGFARIAAPIAGKAVGGFFGGPAGAMLGSKLASLAAKQLRELEYEQEHEFEFEQEQELGEHEVAQNLGEHEAIAELMAHFAAQSANEAEAEALIGAATTAGLSPRDGAALRQLVPNLVRGAAILTRMLRMNRRTRPMVRVVPTILRRTARTLRNGAAQGRPITRQSAAKAITQQTRRVLGSPRYCASVLNRNLSTARRLSVGNGRGTAPARRRG